MKQKTKSAPSVTNKEEVDIQKREQQTDELVLSVTFEAASTIAKYTKQARDEKKRAYHESKQRYKDVRDYKHKMRKAWCQTEKFLRLELPDALHKLIDDDDYNLAGLCAKKTTIACDPYDDPEEHTRVQYKVKVYFGIGSLSFTNTVWKDPEWEKHRDHILIHDEDDENMLGYFPPKKAVDDAKSVSDLWGVFERHTHMDGDNAWTAALAQLYHYCHHEHGQSIREYLLDTLKLNDE